MRSARRSAPDFAPVRKDQLKLGFGVSVEQFLTRDLGVFGRFSWDDGRTETYAFTEIDLSVTAGASMKGRYWLRPDDTIAVAYIQDGLSAAHRDYLARHGTPRTTEELRAHTLIGFDKGGTAIRALRAGKSSADCRLFLAVEMAAWTETGR